MAGTFVEHVNQLATDLTPQLILDITDVSLITADVAVVAANIPSIVTVKNNIIPVNTVAAHIANVDTLATGMPNVNALVPVVADIDALGPQAANIAIVATNMPSVVVAATNMPDVSIVAADIGQVGFSDIEDLGLITEPVTVNPAGVVSYIKTVADNMPNVVTTGTNMPSVVTTAGSIANVNAVAAAIVNVNAVATTVVPNIAELLQVNDNAALVVSLLDQFDDRYLGSKVLEPTLDNDGNVLLVGALYFDTVTNMIRVWDGVLWGDALTLTAASISTLTNKTLDHISNTVGADHIHYKVRNASGSIIPVNTVVTASGTQPGTDYILVTPVTDAQTQIAIGIVHTALAINGTGLVINTGVADDVNTNLWPVGTILYPDNAGSLTNVKPTLGRYQACAIVLRQHTTQGTLLCEFTEPRKTTAEILSDILASGIPIDMGSIV